MPLDKTNWPITETEIIDPTTALLNRARGFLERGWCRDKDARNASGKGVIATADSAVEWSSIGALHAAGVPLNGAFISHPAVKRLRDAIGDYRSIPEFDDHQETVEPVLAAFDRAIAAGG